MADQPTPDRAALEELIASALAEGDSRKAATEALRGYGPQILGYLTALLRDEDTAWEVFSAFSERLWRGIEKFRGEASLRTWAYRIAWNAAQTHLDQAKRRRERRMTTGEFMRVADEVRASVRSSTSTSMSVSAMHDLVARLRAELSPAEQTLLILRIDRELSWKEVASVMAAEGEDVDPAALRKRFERLRVRIAERVAEEKAKRKK